MKMSRFVFVGFVFAAVMVAPAGGQESTKKAGVAVSTRLQVDPRSIGGLPRIRDFRLGCQLSWLGVSTLGIEF
jgi:hypothetical protein